jgi:hypothetical protein
MGSARDNVGLIGLGLIGVWLAVKSIVPVFQVVQLGWEKRRFMKQPEEDRLDVQAYIVIQLIRHNMIR